MPSAARCGLARRDAVILFGLFVVLAGVIVTVIPRQRDRARRAECALHLAHIGQAISFYQGESPAPWRQQGFQGPLWRQALPAARIADGYATWAVLIAPYLTTDLPLLDWDLHKPYREQSENVRQRWLVDFFCPARQRTSKLSVSGDVPADGMDHVPGAVGDYACAAGDGDPARPWTGPQANGAVILGEVLDRNGSQILRWRSRTDFTSLVRGRSYTLLVGEKHVPLGRFGQAAVGDGSLYDGGAPANFSRVGGPGHGLAPSPTAPFNHDFGSYHAGLCQFLMADGSVRPLANDVNERVLGKLIAREK